jgi:hypothetical protein
VITIETKRGQITEATRPVIRNLVEALPDGQHIVNIYAVGSAISEASKIADWYNSIPSDFQDLDTLQKALDGMAYYCFLYTNELGLASQEKRVAQTNSEVGYAVEKMKLRSSGDNFTDANAKAKIASAEMMQIEAIAQAHHEVVAAQLKALDGIQRAIMMRVSQLKKEREFLSVGSNYNFGHERK